MPNYRRVLIPGGSYFFTVNLLDRNGRLLVDHVDRLYAAISETQSRFPFAIDAMVVLPDHIHAVWTLPEGDSDYAVRWRWIKIRFSRSLPNDEPRSAARAARGERGLWQRRYWEHHIRDERDRLAHIDYCWFNPVKHRLVTDVEDWPHSTFHRDALDKPMRSDFERRVAERIASNAPGKFGERE